MTRPPLTVLCPLVTLLGCGGLSPLRSHAVVGRDAYLIFAGDGPGGQSDLFAARADGGPAFQITYTNVAESRPALSPDGGTVGFLRARSTEDSTAAAWVLNLLSGAERKVVLPGGSVQPDRLGWSRDGRSLFVRAGAQVYRLNAPPAAPEPRRVTGAERVQADSSFAVLVGDPPFGRVVPCGGSLCVQADTGAPAPFAEGAQAAVRWGGDSVAILAGDVLLIRPVGPGRARRADWTGLPARPRDLTFFPGRSGQ